MYRFQIRAQAQIGESIVLVGSAPELGLWDLANCVQLYTSVDLYPLWQTDQAIDFQHSLTSTDSPAANQAANQTGNQKGGCQKIEYKYVRFAPGGGAQWESLGTNRWMSIDFGNQSETIVVDDGAFGYWQPCPFGYLEESTVELTPKPDPSLPPNAFGGLKIVVIGSSVAAGHKAWLLQGWVEQLRQHLQKYGHQLVNVSEVGATVRRAIDRFPSVVAPETPDIVIIALSLGNEGFAYCPPHERRAVQRRFESGLQQLVQMVRQLEARPILGSVYPHGDYTLEHYGLLQDTHNRMLSWGVPVLNWLAAVDDGQGRWREGLSFDPAHPNTKGHHFLHQAIDLSLFPLDKAELAAETQRFQQQNDILIYLDQAGFQVSTRLGQQQLRITNPSQHSYTIAPYWKELQTALRHANLIPGLYIAKQAQRETLSFFAVQQDGAIETTLTIPPDANLEYTAAFNLFSPNHSQLLFYDGYLGILKQDEQHLWIINESDHEFNVHPMWREVRSALKALLEGVYEDPLHPDVPFRTLMIGRHGLESRVKVAARSAVLFQYKCELSDISRVAIIPLGDRCAVRMMLYKMEYDGPAFPFDLTRTTQIADVADIIESRFHDMWNPACLHYSADAGRMYHSKWTGLSFAHEVEDTDDPQHDMSPIYERMRVRYSARSERFWYTIQACDKVLFVRTGIADRGGAIDLVNKLEKHCQGKPFLLLLFSPQSSAEFSDLANVSHYSMEFNADRMYEDLGHWMYCTDVMHGILDSLGVSSKNLFWCPPTPPESTP
jgi:lysophospholipase L1-like esterase